MSSLHRPRVALITALALASIVLFVLVAGSFVLQATVSPRSCAQAGGSYSFKANGGFTCSYPDGSSEHCFFGGFCTTMSAPAVVAPGAARTRSEPEEVAPNIPSAPEVIAPSEPEPVAPPEPDPVVVEPVPEPIVEPPLTPEQPPAQPPPPLPPAEVPQVECLVCEYMNNVPRCGGSGDRDDCKKFGSDCFSYRGLCKNRFLKRCETEAEKWGRRGPVFISPAGAPGDRDLTSCTSIDFLYDGHSTEGAVSRPFEVVDGCVNVAPNLRAVRVLNDGCLTFRNVDQAIAHANRLRERLANIGLSSLVVEVSANQAPSDNGVTTHFTFNVNAPDGLVLSAEACHGPTDFCFGDPNEEQSVLCQVGGRWETETCCRTSRWVRGNNCALSRCPGEGRICGFNDGMAIGRSQACQRADGTPSAVVCCRSSDALVAAQGIGAYQTGTVCR